MSAFEIRLADERDRERLFSVLSLWFPRTLTARYEWIYVSNPHGRALTWLAIDRATGETVGCTSLFPRRVMVEGRVRTGSIGGDCFIVPRYRRRGLATALHRETAGAMRGLGVDFMYGPPEPRNLAALLKAGSRVVARFDTWARPLRAEAVSRALFGRGAPRAVSRLTDLLFSVADRLLRRDAGAVSVEPVSAFPPEFDRMFEEAARTHRIACVRDSAYLTWRYLTSPARRQVPLAVRRHGEVVGFAAVETEGDRAFLTDVFTAADPGLVDSALQAVMDRVKAAGGSILVVDVTAGSSVARRLRRLGFIRREEADFQVMVAPEDPQAGILGSPGAWHFCTADKDIDTLFREDREPGA